MSRNQPGGLPGIFTNVYPREYEQYNSQYGGQIEAIGWKWWDTQTFVSGTTTRLPQWFNVRATRDLSNMEVAFQLPAPKAFLIRAIRLFIKSRPRTVTPAMTVNNAVATGGFDDIVQLINTGVMDLNIGNKMYALEPLYCLTSGAGAWGFFAPVAQTGGNGGPASASYAQVGLPDPRAVNTLSKPIFIAPQINFNATLDWPAVITLVGGDTTITLFIDGDLLRPVQ